jgi:hypothetical protein
MEFEKDDATIRETICADIPRHEVLLSFNDDEQGEAFRDWWLDQGIRAFKKYCKHYVAS